MLSANTMENRNGSIMQNDDIMSTNGQLASDLDFSTTAAARNMESSDDDADYPGRMSTGGYGGSENMDDDLEDDAVLDDEDALDDEDDTLAEDEDLANEDDDTV